MIVNEIYERIVRKFELDGYSQKRNKAESDRFQPCFNNYSSVFLVSSF